MINLKKNKIDKIFFRTRASSQTVVFLKRFILRINFNSQENALNVSLIKIRENISK